MQQKRLWELDDLKDYKCINCDETMPSIKACTCPVCGFKMFPLPFDKKEVLSAEILRFFDGFKHFEIDYDLIDYYRFDDEIGEKIYKYEDDNRFPSFEKICKYLLSATKTEEFAERVNRTVDNFYNHFTVINSYNYSSDYSDLIKSITKHDDLLLKSAELFNKDIIFDELKFKNVSMKYKQVPDIFLEKKAEALLNLMKQLVEKIIHFTKINNIYGSDISLRLTINDSKIEEEPFDALNKAIKDTSDILNKRYEVDFFSDGTDELKEMILQLIYCVHYLRELPILLDKIVYSINGSEINQVQFQSVIESTINDRYINLLSGLTKENLMLNYSEKALLDKYISLIEMDEFDFLKINKNDLKLSTKSEKKLDELIGLSVIKESIKKIKAYALVNKDSDDLSLHMCFYGNPGTGKTEVARLIAGILHENEILPSEKVVEVDRSDLVAEYMGQTAIKTMEVIKKSVGGVLFIDEAYSLVPSTDGHYDYGDEAISTLIKAMEDYRGQFCVILAGYKKPMQDMISSNPGFKSRIQFTLDFPNYSRDELEEIAKLIAKKKKYTFSDIALNRILDITDIKRKDPDFANAREIRNIIEQVIMCQNIRCIDANNKKLELVDVNKYIQDYNINLPLKSGNEKKEILTADEELEHLIGLNSVKRMVKKIRAYAKKNKDDEDFNLHMCFYGNPGTGKTEVARIISRILYDAGVLKESKIIETDAHGLIGQYVGQTAPKTMDKINSAMDGVLFIDEAYGLTDKDLSDGNSGYGKEAVETLIKAMEDFRGKFCVILAGYKNEMNDLLSSNPGFESRIQFVLDFPDYSRDELSEIIKLFINKKRYSIDEDALEYMLRITDYMRDQPNFANARTARNIVDKVILNQNLRTEDEDDNNIVYSDVQDYIIDENIDLNKNPTKSNRIGF